MQGTKPKEGNRRKMEKKGHPNGKKGNKVPGLTYVAPKDAEGARQG